MARREQKAGPSLARMSAEHLPQEGPLFSSPSLLPMPGQSQVDQGCIPALALPTLCGLRQVSGPL